MLTLVKNILISARGFRNPKTGKIGVILRDACDDGTAQMAQFLAIEIVSRPNRHSKDVPFVCEFW